MVSSWVRLEVSIVGVMYLLHLHGEPIGFVTFWLFAILLRVSQKLVVTSLVVTSELSELAVNGKCIRYSSVSR